MISTSITVMAVVSLIQIANSNAAALNEKSKSPQKAFSVELCGTYKRDRSSQLSEAAQLGKNIINQPWISVLRKADGSEVIEIKLTNAQILNFKPEFPNKGDKYWVEEIDCKNSFLIIGLNDSSGEGFHEKVFSLQNGKELLSSRLLGIMWSPQRDFAVTYYTDSEFEGEDFRVFRRNGNSFDMVWDGSKKYRLQEDTFSSSIVKGPVGIFAFHVKTKGKRIETKTVEEEDSSFDAPIYQIQNYRVECPIRTSSECKIKFESNTEESWQPG